MSDGILGTLEEVDVRDAWQHEAHNFTPWLAENLERLSATVDIPLELVGQEVAVDTFSADILARNPMDGSTVLIENQLEGSDHGHLGQILTYLAGLDAQTIIWVATGFRDAHLSAINWLNENTDDAFSFFAVRTKVVRIGNSPMAPVFEVLARPNDWERKLQRTKKDSQALSDQGKTRKEFWTAYVERYPEEAQFGGANADVSHWHPLPEHELVVALFLAQNEVGVFIRGLRGVDYSATAERLEPFADALANKLDTQPGGRFLFKKAKQGNYADPSARGPLMDWLNETARIYEATIRAVLEERN
jgi:hypothetical protein